MDFLDHIDSVAHGIKEVATWHASGELIAEVETENQCDAKADYVYEFYCLSLLVRDFSRNYRVELLSGSLRHPRKFPRKPALKRGWPRFQIHDPVTQILLMQICAGTEISVTDLGLSHAPDISFQKADASEAPNGDDLLAIFDAKYNEEGSKKKALSKGQFSEVTQMIRDFKLMKPFPISLPVEFDKLKDFSANCILTNGGPLNENHAYHRENCIRVIHGLSSENNHFQVVG